MHRRPWIDPYMSARSKPARDSRRHPPPVTRLRIGAITLALHSRKPTQSLSLPKKYDPFRPSRGGDIRLELVEEEAPALSPPDLLFDSGGLWRVYRLGEMLAYTFRSPEGDDPFCRVLVIDPLRRHGRLILSPSRHRCRPGFALSYPLDEILYQHRAACRDALVLHGCGVAVRRRALLFLGESGAGKTTMARLWRHHHPGAAVLSDDRILIQVHRNRWWAFGTPWHGSGRFASPAGAQLAAVFFLRHGRLNRLEALPAAATAAQLFTRTFPPMWEPATVERVLSTCARLAEAIPCRSLEFQRDESVIQRISHEFLP
jgi:hypothetical protein